MNLVLQSSSTVYMNSTGVYNLRVEGRAGAFSVVLPFEVASALEAQLERGRE